MKYIRPLFFACLALFLTTSCLREECRDCEPFNYEAAAFNPDFTDRDLVVVDSAGQEFTFNYLRTVSTPGGEVCLGRIDSPDEIVCTTVSNIGFRSEGLGIDMLISFEEQARFGEGEEDVVAMSFAFKGRDATQFSRTHLTFAEPEVVLSDNVVEFRDSVTLRDSLYEGVLELIRPAEAFVLFGEALPPAGRFSSIYFQQGVGLIGMRRLDGDLLLVK